MSDDFESLGIAADLVGAAAAAGFDEPTPVQSQAIPVLRRGGNVVLMAGSGSGVTAAYALGLLDRLANETAVGTPPTQESGPLRPRVLVVTPTEDRATAVARTFARLGGDRSVRALTLAWGGRGEPAIVVGSVSRVARSVRESGLKLDAVEALVFDRLTAMFSIEEPAVLETVAASVPAAAQRVLTAGEPSKAVERFAEAHARRAMTIPPRVREIEPAPAIAPAGSLSYVVAVTAQKPAALARILRRPRTEPPVVVTRSRAGASKLRAELALRGFTTDGPAPDARIRAATDVGATALIAYDVPVDAAVMATMDLTNGLVIAEPDELPHLAAMAAAANVTLKAVGGARATRGSVAAFRERVRKALRDEDLDAQVMLLEPLLEESDAIEVAAALSALLRTKQVEAGPEPTQAGQAGDKPQAFVKLFVSAGSRDNIRPGDLVGAITGEASVTGEQVGRIEIRDTFAVVEVASDIADKVIRALNGTTLRGRSLRVDYDRRGPAGPRPQRMTRSPR